MGEPRDSESPGRELRRFTRRVVAFEITLESESQFYSGFSENISEGGVFVATHLLRPVGASIEVEFTLAGLRTPIHVDGVVRWVREAGRSSDAPPGIGIEFGALGAEDLEAIRRFCSARSPLFYA